MDIPFGYRERIRQTKSRYGKIYTYRDLVPIKTPKSNAPLVTSRSGKQYRYYYKHKGRAHRLDTWNAIRNQLLYRANGHCERCGGEFSKLHIHHKDGNGLLSKNPNNSIDNLIVVCPSCHLILHGLKNLDQIETIIHFRKEGLTLQKIGNITSLSRQRIFQILKKYANFPVGYRGY